MKGVKRCSSSRCMRATLSTLPGSCREGQAAGGQGMPRMDARVQLAMPGMHAQALKSGGAARHELPLMNAAGQIGRGCARLHCSSVLQPGHLWHYEAAPGGVGPGRQRPAGLQDAPHLAIRRRQVKPAAPQLECVVCIPSRTPQLPAARMTGAPTLPGKAQHTARRHPTTSPSRGGPPGGPPVQRRGHDSKVGAAAGQPRVLHRPAAELGVGQLRGVCQLLRRGIHPHHSVKQRRQVSGGLPAAAAQIHGQPTLGMLPSQARPAQDALIKVVWVAWAQLRVGLALGRKQAGQRAMRGHAVLSGP